MSCGDGEFVYTQERTLDDFKEYRDGAFEVNGDEVIKNLANMAAADQGGLSADKFTRNYYKEKGKPLWIDYKGIDWRVDSLEEWLKATEAVGISPAVFRLKQISEDLETFRSYSFDDAHNINALIARLDYNLTRAYLRYLSGQRFGFVNPDAVLNRLYKKPEDSLSNKYIRLFDIPLRRANDDFFTTALRCSSTDSIIAFVQASQPVGSLYHRLVSELQRNNAGSVRQKILCNIERCRWRQKDYPENHEKYVVVNIPSFNLYAVDKEKTIHMRIGCGAVKTKTPLLTSRVVRMDLNPQWIVPKSIAKGIAYSYSYMQKERMFIFDKTRGKLPCTESSLERILSGEQYIIQKGGEGNSLGRIIFRFPNNFSVYLHDTNTPWMLQRDFRAISHGCIRVERPFELAEFMLEKKEQSVIDKIHDTTTKDSVSRSISISPEVPIYITYYTFYPNESNVLQSYPDVYGYDEAIFERLKAFIKE